MTLLLALANDSYSLVLGDRRLVCDGRVAEDEANKVCVLFCDDARVAIAYTGLAVHGSFTTKQWLLDTLYEIGAEKHTLDEILFEFQTRTSRVFSRLSGPAQLIAFLISGFRYSTDTEKVCYLLSNYDPNAVKYIAGDKLELRALGAPGTETVEAAGFKSVLTKRDYSSLRRMLAAGNAAHVVLRKAVEIVQRVSKEGMSRGWIGAQCNSAVVPQLPDTIIVGTYHSAATVSEVFGQDVVLAITGCRAVVADMKLTADKMILAGPLIRKNDDCWCGSGKRFKVCHLKKFGSVYAQLPGFRKPMSMISSFTKKQPVLSGSKYVVTSSFV